MKTIQRLKKYIDYKGISLNAFDSKIDSSNGYIGKQIKNNASIGSDIIEKIICTYDDLNPLWLINGEGNMLRVESNKLDMKSTSEKSIPLIPVEAFAGFGGDNGFAIDLDMIEDRYVIPLFEGKGVDFLIPVRGSSMYPKYSSGDIVACKFVKEILFIQWNKVYVLDTKSQGAMIKRLKKSADATKLVCKSDNKEYDDFEVPLSDINNLALVIGVIRLE